MPDLTIRNLQGELMDDPALDPKLHRQALRGLNRINWVTRSLVPVWRAVRRLAENKIECRPIRILDPACGSGNNLLQLERWSQAARIPLKLIGQDISPTAIETCKQVVGKTSSIEFSVADALSGESMPAADIVFNTLFMHHLDEHQSVHLLSRMKQAANHAVIVADLLRSKWGYWTAWIGTRILSRSQIVHIDGPRSVEAAYTVAEMKALFAKAGMADVSTRNYWPSRVLIFWEHPNVSPEVGMKR